MVERLVGPMVYLMAEILVEPREARTAVYWAVHSVRQMVATKVVSKVRVHLTARMALHSV